MVKSVEELKELVIWLKSQRVKSLKIGDVTVELSDYAFIESLSEEVPLAAETKPSSKEASLDESALSGDADNDDILYHSSRS